MTATRPGVTPLHWTVPTFHRACSIGLFEGRRAILLRGVILEQGKMNPPHAVAILIVNEVLRVAFGSGWTIRVQLPLILSQETDPVPDLAVVPGGVRDFAAAHPTMATLVVEVSDTTLDPDLTIKAEIYATAGVLDYWVIDVENRQLHVFRDPVPLPEGLGATAYRSHVTLAATDSVSPLAQPNHSIRVTEMLP